VISDTMFETADSRTDVALVNAVDRTTSNDCNRLASVDSADEFMDTVKLRAIVAKLSLDESETSAFCNDDTAVEIPELNDWFCDPRADTSPDSTLLMDWSADFITETALCKAVEAESMLLARTEVALEMDNDNTALIELHVDT